MTKRGVYLEECGCTHDNFRWLTLCPKHQAEADETRARWAAEHLESCKEVDHEKR